MAVPYHTHTFEIPTATTQDMAARAANDKAVTPSVLGTAATADVSQFATAEQGKKADSAVQPQSLNSLAYKDKITVNEINTNGAPSNTTFLSGNGWKNLTGGGDMTVAIYDPQNKRADAFDMANMKEADNAKILTADERNKIAKLGDNYLSKSGGTITGEIRSTGWFTYVHQGDPDTWGLGFRVVSSQRPDYFAEFDYQAGGARVYVNGYGDVATFQRNGGLSVAEFVLVGGSTILQKDGNIAASLWQGGHLFQHIENRCAAFADDRRNWSVTDSRVSGWAVCATDYTWNHLPSGYFATAANRMQYNEAVVQLGGRQPQLFVPARGWFPLGGW